MPQAVHTRRGPRGAISAQGSGSGTGVLSRSNFTYVGCFGLFEGSDAGAMASSQGGAAARIRPSDGKLVFFVTREEREGIPGGVSFPVYEVEDPLSYSTNYATAPRSANAPTARKLGSIRGEPYLGPYMRSWFNAQGPIPGGFSAGDERAPSGGGFFPAGMYWNEDTQLLYTTYYDTYNTQGYQDWGLLATSLNSYNSGTNTYSTTTYGPWRVKCTNSDGVSYHGAWRCLALAKHPTTGKMMCSSSLMSGNVSSPFGPDLYGGADWPTASTPSGYGNPDIVMPDRYLESYYMGSQIFSDGSYTPPLRSYRRRDSQLYIWETDPRPTYLNINPGINGNVGSWSEEDSSNIGTWLQLTNTKGVIWFGTLLGATSQDSSNRDAGHGWYQVGGSTCSHGHLPYLSNQGPVSTHSFPVMFIYNPDDLNTHKNTSTDYVPEPVDQINLEDYFGIRTPDMNTRGWKSLGFVYFDSSRNYLFALSLYADNVYATAGGSGALMHVFHIADVA